MIAMTPPPPATLGHDLPPFTPDVSLSVDATASRWLGAWYAFGARHLDRLRITRASDAVSAAHLRPEHFDVAVVIELASGSVNVGSSPGDHRRRRARRSAPFYAASSCAPRPIPTA